MRECARVCESVQGCLRNRLFRNRCREIKLTEKGVIHRRRKYEKEGEGDRERERMMRPRKRV